MLSRSTHIRNAAASSEAPVVVGARSALFLPFAKLGLIPKPVNVSDIVWKWTPGS